MDKIKSSWLYFLFGVLLGSGIFLGLYGRVHAEEISGEEAIFTHTHSDACKRTEIKYCSLQHSFYGHHTEYLDLHCHACNTRVNAVAEIDTHICYEANTSWHENAYASCPNCGNVISSWKNGGGVHTYSVTFDACGIMEGEKTTGVCIQGEDDWTNQGVWLTASVTKYKNDPGNAALSYSWQNGRFFAEENGTYSVTVRNALGQAAVASFTVSCIDKIPPTVTSVTGDTAGMTRERIEVTVSAEDEESGLAEEAYSTDGGATWRSSASFTVTEGTDLHILVRDRAGNTVERTVARGEFPYPPEPAPAPAPEPAPAPVPVDPDIQAGTSDTPEQPLETSAPAQTEQEVQNKSAKNQGNKGNENPVKEKAANESAKQTGEESSDKEDGTVSRKNVWQDQGKAYQAAYLTDTEETFAGRFTVFRLGKASAEEEESAAVLRIRLRSEGMENGAEENSAKEKASASFWENLMAYGRSHASLLGGSGLVCMALLLLFRLFWLHSAVLYCYDGGEEYYRIALLRLKRQKKEFSLYLPEELLKEAKTPRYRLLLKEGLVKRFNSMDLVVQSGSYKLRQPLEECVDFVL